MISAGVHMFLLRSSCTTTFWDCSSLGSTGILVVQLCLYLFSMVHDLSVTFLGSLVGTIQVGSTVLYFLGFSNSAGNGSL